MSLQKNVKLLETVLEELEADRPKGNASNQKFLKPIKSAKASKNRACKTKKPKSVKNATDDSKEIRQKIVVDVPNTEKEENRNAGNIEVLEMNKDADDEVENKSVVETSNKTENPHNLNHESETSTDNYITKDNESDKTNAHGDSQMEKLFFSRVFSLRNKETISSQNDITITPNIDAENECTRSEGDNNKENQLTEEDSNRSQEFLRSNSDKSILTIKSEPRASGPPHKFPKRRRPKSTSALSKKVLEAYLPRKSFFSSHDKVLREAGFQVDDAMKNKKRPNWRLILRMHTEEELNPDLGTEQENTVVSEHQIKEESDDDGEESTNLMDAVETLMSQEKASKRKLRLAAKKLALEEKCEYKPLLEYLKYINEHPEEYMSMTRYSSKNTDYKHPSVMVRMARVYRKAHHGTARNNIFTHALAGLKPKIADATAQRHGRSEHGRNEFGASKKDQTENPQEQSSVSQDEGKSEMEKLKIKTEKWMGGLTTMQTLKAKEYALKDMGEEDITVTKWWLAFKTCNYLRIPPTVLEQAQ